MDRNLNANTARISVLVGDRFSCIKVAGRANFNSSVDFKTLVNELRSRGFHYFILDLSECVLMDSTFLGVLTGFGLQVAEMKSAGNPGTNAAIELLNPNPRITDLLENLGVLHLFKLAEGPLQPPPGAETLPHTPVCPTHAEVTEACLEAHRILMAVNPDNIPRFKDVAQFLAEDLKKLKAAN